MTKPIIYNKIIGKTISKIYGLKPESKDIWILFDDKSMAQLYHFQIYDERVRIKECIGKPEDLINRKIKEAQESSWIYKNLQGDPITYTTIEIAADESSMIINWVGEADNAVHEGVDDNYFYFEDERGLRETSLINEIDEDDSPGFFTLKQIRNVLIEMNVDPDEWYGGNISAQIDFLESLSANEIQFAG